MDIQTIVATEYCTAGADTPASKLAAEFTDPTCRGVVVTEGKRFLGVVTRRRFLSSHRNPGEKARSLVWHVPTVGPSEDVREVAGLMRESDSGLLPVEDGGGVVGVVTVTDVIRAVQPALSAVDVGAVSTPEPIFVEPGDRVGRALHLFREEHISHLPVVDDSGLVGIVSLVDVVPFVARAVDRAQGGSSGVDTSGGSRGGFGSREGDTDDMLEVPVRDFMSAPVLTAEADDGLDDAVSRMLERDVSSVVVVDDDGDVTGIVTYSDILDALARETPGRRAVQVVGMDLTDDMSYPELVDLVEGIMADSRASLLDAKVHLHEHDETLRGTPLLFARMRLFTDRGMFIASGEGYGAKQAIGEATDAIKRQLRDRKTYARSKKHPTPEEKAQMRGWESTE
ncbi:CBS domain-containing protein [Haloarchaeobius sp. DFWS5]|uniref:CBS domain-containing protein n=1 Tax=Haloarchaeobius sp. DFWS5 TaxID=3446114 RepID=UPI003EB7C00E